MTDAERKAQEAETLLEALRPYIEKAERTTYEALLVESDPSKVELHRLQILAFRKVLAELQTVMTLGKQAARKAPPVA